MMRRFAYDVMDANVHERLELTLSHVHKVESNSALCIALR